MGDIGGGRMVGPDELGGLFQPYDSILFYDSVSEA